MTAAGNDLMIAADQYAFDPGGTKLNAQDSSPVPDLINAHKPKYPPVKIRIFLI